MPVSRNPRRSAPSTGARRAPRRAGAALAALPFVLAAAPGPDPGGAGHRHSSPAAVERVQDDWLGSQIRKHEGEDLWDPDPDEVTAARRAGRAARVHGMDVSSHQGRVDWSGAYAEGARFVYVKATEGRTYQNPYFEQQYGGSYRARMIRGAYHFALLDRSSGRAQARYFVRHGGGWSADGRTLPPALDVEYNPYGTMCYGMSHAAVIRWIRGFSTTVRAMTGRYPVIYTSAKWWKRCTGGSRAFARTNPLWICGHSKLPAGWVYFTFWQHATSGRFPGDQDLFNGPGSRLRVLARSRR